MANARISIECNVTVPDQPGVGAKIADAIGAAGINIMGFCAWAGDGQAHFMIVAEDGDRACKSLEGAGLSCECKDVVLVEAPNRAGAVADMLRKVSAAGVNVHYCYATALGSGNSLCVFRTGDNARAIQALR